MGIISDLCSNVNRRLAVYTLKESKAAFASKLYFVTAGVVRCGCTAIQITASSHCFPFTAILPVPS